MKSVEKKIDYNYGNLAQKLREENERKEAMIYELQKEIAQLQLQIQEKSFIIEKYSSKDIEIKEYK